MFDLSEPSDQLYSMEIVSLITAQDLVGLRSLSSAGDPPPPTPASHAASLVLLEDGEDAASLGYLRPIIQKARSPAFTLGDRRPDAHGPRARGGAPPPRG